MALGSVWEIDAASGTVGDAQQSAVVPAPSPQVECGTRSPITGPLLGGTGGVPTRLGVAMCAGCGLVGPWSAAGGDGYHGSGFRVRCWSAAGPARHSSG